MKTFSDLEFKPHASARRAKAKNRGAEIAKMEFPAGHGISVIRGSSFFACGPGTYEVAVYYKANKRVGRIRRYQTSRQITEIMKELQA